LICDTGRRRVHARPSGPRFPHRPSLFNVQRSSHSGVANGAHVKTQCTLAFYCNTNYLACEASDHRRGFQNASGFLSAGAALQSTFNENFKTTIASDKVTKSSIHSWMDSPRCGRGISAMTVPFPYGLEPITIELIRIKQCPDPQATGDLHIRRLYSDCL
jgi:hypothetical protein